MESRSCPQGASNSTSTTRLLCLDLDGTTYNSQNKVSVANATAISDASKAGWIVCFCTGRGPTMYIPTAREVGVDQDIYLVGYNGAVVYKLGRDGEILETLFETLITDDAMTALLRVAGDNSLKVDSRETVYADFKNEKGKKQIEDHTKVVADRPQIIDMVSEFGKKTIPKNKVTIFTEDPVNFAKSAVEVVPELAKTGMAVLPAGPFWTETVNVSHDKAVAIRLISDTLGVSLERAVALGDAANDASMLKACGHSIAMAQATPEAKLAANYVSKWTNDEDAVAREINQILSNDEKEKSSSCCSLFGP